MKRFKTLNKRFSIKESQNSMFLRPKKEKNHEANFFGFCILCMRIINFGYGC